MNIIDTIIEFSDSLEEKTISEVLDDCIETAENNYFPLINTNWFGELKIKIEEEELKIYCFENILPFKYILNNNRVIKTERGLEITNQTKDFTYLRIYFPSEFNPNSLIIARS